MATKKAIHVPTRKAPSRTAKVSKPSKAASIKRSRKAILAGDVATRKYISAKDVYKKAGAAASEGILSSFRTLGANAYLGALNMATGYSSKNTYKKTLVTRISAVLLREAYDRAVVGCPGCMDSIRKGFEDQVLKFGGGEDASVAIGEAMTLFNMDHYNSTASGVIDNIDTSVRLIGRVKAGEDRALAEWNTTCDEINAAEAGLTVDEYLAEGASKAT
jgi:hypothetical protein